MPKLRKILFTLLLVTIPFYVYADCESDKKEFERIESQFKVSYEYNANNDSFTITLYNPQYNKYSYLFYDFEAYEKDINTNGATKTIKIKGYKKTEFKYWISKEKNCKSLKNETITLKKPNKYANSDLCDGYEDFVLCQEDYEKEIDQETFESRLETYKQSLEKEKEIEIQEKEEKKEKEKITFSQIIDKIIDFIEENLTTIIIVIVFLIILTVSTILMVKSYIKSRRLE